MTDADRADDAQTIAMISGECLGVRLRLLNRMVTAIFDDALRPIGLRIGQLNLLVAVARMGSPRPSDLCRVLQMDKSTLSRDLEVLRRNGWLAVDGGGEGRSRPIRLSPSGSDTIRAAAPAWRTAQDKAVAVLGGREARAITQTVDRLWASIPETA